MRALTCKNICSLSLPLSNHLTKIICKMPYNILGTNVMFFSKFYTLLYYKEDMYCKNITARYLSSTR